VEESTEESGRRKTISISYEFPQVIPVPSERNRLRKFKIS
jgi:hypothetical protein